MKREKRRKESLYAWCLLLINFHLLTPSFCPRSIQSLAPSPFTTAILLLQIVLGQVLLSVLSEYFSFPQYHSVLGQLQSCLQPQSSGPFFFPFSHPSLSLSFILSLGRLFQAQAELLSVIVITGKMGLIPVWLWHLASWVAGSKLSLHGCQTQRLSYCLPLQNGIITTTPEQLGGLKG